MRRAAGLLSRIPDVQAGHRSRHPQLFSLRKASSTVTSWMVTGFKRGTVAVTALSSPMALLGVKANSMQLQV